MSEWYIGLMSGTSLDGVDAALLEVTGAGPDTQWKLLAFQGTPFPSEVRNEIFGLQCFYSRYKFGIDWRVVELAALVRENQMTREAALAELA